MTDYSWWKPILSTTKEKGREAVQETKEALGRTFSRCYGYQTVPDHNNKRCVDFMSYSDKAMGDWLVDYLIKEKDRFGVELIIWQKRIWRNYDKDKGSWVLKAGTWEDYYGPNPHRDHPHVQFNTKPLGAEKEDHVPDDDPGDRAKITKNATEVTLWVIKSVRAYNGWGQKHQKVLKNGEKVTGWVDRDPFGDGRYLRINEKPHRLWFPLDSGNFSHEEDGDAIGFEKHRDPKPGHFIVREGPKEGEEYEWVNPVDVSQINRCRKNGWFSKHIFITQHWLNRAGFLTGHSTGVWRKKDQEAYDRFRRQVGYKGADAQGSVGVESLTKLGKRVKSNRRVQK